MWHGEGMDEIKSYLEKNPDVGKLFASDDDNEYFEDTDFVSDINYEIMGSSEYYVSRVFESGSIVYSPENVYLEEIKL